MCFGAEGIRVLGLRLSVTDVPHLMPWACGVGTLQLGKEGVGWKLGPAVARAFHVDIAPCGGSVGAPTFEKLPEFRMQLYCCTLNPA